jgi:hypothetical protein
MSALAAGRPETVPVNLAHEAEKAAAAITITRRCTATAIALADLEPALARRRRHWLGLPGW